MHWTQKARKERGAKLVVWLTLTAPDRRKGRCTFDAQAGNRCRVGLRRDARAACRRPCRSGLPGAPHRYFAERGTPSGQQDAGVGGGRLPVDAIVALPGSTARPGAAFCASAMASPGSATARRQCTPLPACRRRPVRGRRKAGGRCMATAAVRTRSNFPQRTRRANRAHPTTRHSLGAVLAGDKKALRDGPPVTAMLIQNTNPAVVAPESLAVRHGLVRDDLFVCVHEQFMTDTARLADIVLPATMFHEHDDLARPPAIRSCRRRKRSPPRRASAVRITTSSACWRRDSASRTPRSP